MGDTGKTILLVEDNAGNRELASDLLSHSGFHVLCADEAEEGIRLAREHVPDLILMDLSLPGRDGLEAVREIHRHKETARIRVVAFTAHAMKGDREKALAAGFSGYITKPIDTRSFVETVTGFLNSQTTQDNADEPE